MTRIHFTFETPEDIGIGGESMHAERVGDGPRPNTGLYRIDNIPFFAATLRMADVVVCEEQPGEMPEIKEVHERGPQPTAVMVFTDGTSEEDMRFIAASLRELGCDTERGMATLWALALPADDDKRERVLDALDAGTKIGLLQYETEEE